MFKADKMSQDLWENMTEKNNQVVFFNQFIHKKQFVKMSQISKLANYTEAIWSRAETQHF